MSSSQTPSRASEAWIAFSATARKEVVRILRIWAQTLLPPVITTSLYFVIFGPILGGRIGQMEGYTYLQYVTPGLIMMAVITNSYQNVVSSFFGAKFQRHVEEMLVSPMPASAILMGYVAGGVFRGLLIGLIVSIVSLAFAQLPVMHPMLVVSMAVFTAVAFCARWLHQCSARAQLRRRRDRTHFRSDSADDARRGLLLGQPTA